MIHHISIDAKNPQHVADVLAEITGGQAVPAPPNFPEGSRFVLVGDEHGSMIEVLPCGTEFYPGNPEADFHTNPLPEATYVATHAYVSVQVSVDDLFRIGQREGWLTRRCDRGFFELVECWIENRLMIEFAPPEMKAQYLGFLTNPEAMQAAFAQPA
ncbi:MAG: hypothetical protein JNJ50_02280 [Acidobacteria bacterium]|nr:hypothetical protein [Acidobacteriota bacterium]